MTMQIEKLTKELAEILLAQKRVLTAAESCTGGGLCYFLTALAGSSQWFERGFVTYSNQAKHELLEVPLDMIEYDGAVSATVAGAMALGALVHSAANVSIAITGIAGPGGGSTDKPVGTVWFAWAIKNIETGAAEVMTEQQCFPGNRQAVREASIIHALEKCADILRKKS